MVPNGLQGVSFFPPSAAQIRPALTTVFQEVATGPINAAADLAQVAAGPIGRRLDHARTQVYPRKGRGIDNNKYFGKFIIR